MNAPALRLLSDAARPVRSFASLQTRDMGKSVSLLLAFSVADFFFFCKYIFAGKKNLINRVTAIQF